MLECWMMLVEQSTYESKQLGIRTTTLNYLNLIFNIQNVGLDNNLIWIYKKLLFATFNSCWWNINSLRITALRQSKNPKRGPMLVEVLWRWRELCGHCVWGWSWCGSQRLSGKRLINHWSIIRATNCFRMHHDRQISLRPIVSCFWT